MNLVYHHTSIPGHSPADKILLIRIPTRDVWVTIDLQGEELSFMEEEHESIGTNGAIKSREHGEPLSRSPLDQNSIPTFLPQQELTLQKGQSLDPSPWPL